MRLACTVATGYRSTPTIKQQNKHIKSTLALCRHPKLENIYMIIHFTAKNKTGTKYNINGNVVNVSTRFVNEGKATIQFKDPAHDLYINADVIQLKSFLMILKKALDGKLTSKELTVSSLSVTPLKKTAPVKMEITNRSELPAKGFPRTLQYLNINDIGLATVCIGILQLQKLRVLDLHNNNLETLPDDLSTLRLEKLNVSNNKLGLNLKTDWNWIGGVLTKTLKCLDLSKNQLRYLPHKIAKLRNISSLNVNDNFLKTLPGNFTQFNNLCNLYVENNQLTHLSALSSLPFEHLSISGNKFKKFSDEQNKLEPLSVISLKEYSAREILNSELPYTLETIPKTLCDYLDGANYCVCGNPCFDFYLRTDIVIHLYVMAISFSTSPSDNRFLPIICYLCSNRCLKRFLSSSN